MVLYERGQSTSNLGQYAERMVFWNSLKADAQISVQQLHCPGVSSKAKDTEKLSIHVAADQETN